MYHDTFRALRSKTRETNLENGKAALEAALIPPSEDQVWKEKLKRVWDDVYGTSANFIGKYLWKHSVDINEFFHQSYFTWNQSLPNFRGTDFTKKKVTNFCIWEKSIDRVSFVIFHYFCISTFLFLTAECRILEFDIAKINVEISAKDRHPLNVWDFDSFGQSEENSFLIEPGQNRDILIFKTEIRSRTKSSFFHSFLIVREKER